MHITQQMSGGDDNYGSRVIIVIVCSSVTDIVADNVRDDVNHRAKNNDDKHSAAAVVVAPFSRRFPRPSVQTHVFKSTFGSSAPYVCNIATRIRVLMCHKRHKGWNYEL
jgi:hypothetical protein